MRIFQSEFAHDYGTYCFGYTIHAAVDPDDTIGEVYARGFLPYSGNPKLHNVLYMARSVRVPLATFTPNSENRRVLKKFDDQFTSRVISHQELKTDTEFHTLFLSYFKERHGNIMECERFEGILESKLPLRGVRYESKEGALIAAVLEVADANCFSFWFSAYDTSYIGASLGMWLMLDAVRRGKIDGREYGYLGTAYGEKALYKLNVADIEFWDGEKWIADVKELKRRVQNDLEQTVTCGTPFDIKTVK